MKILGLIESLGIWMFLDINLRKSVFIKWIKKENLKFTLNTIIYLKLLSLIRFRIKNRKLSLNLKKIQIVYKNNELLYYIILKLNYK